MNLVFSISQDWLKRTGYGILIAEIPQSRVSLGNLNWGTLNVDGASRQTESGIDLQLKSPSREKTEQEILLGFSASNNKSEYATILVEIELAATVLSDKLLI